MENRNYCRMLYGLGTLVLTLGSTALILNNGESAFASRLGFSDVGIGLTYVVSAVKLYHSNIYSKEQHS